MKNIVTTYSLKIFENLYTNDDLLRIKYSIEGIYINVSKIIVLTLLSYIFNMTYLFLTFMILFTPLRIFGYGYHASTSFKCYLLSIFSFLVLPYAFNMFKLPAFMFLFLSTFSVFIFFLYAPKSTPKGLSTRKNFYFINKSIIIILSLLYISLGIQLDEYRNLICLALLLEGFYITPFLYTFLPNKV